MGAAVATVTVAITLEEILVGAQAPAVLKEQTRQTVRQTYQGGGVGGVNKLC